MDSIRRVSDDVRQEMTSPDLTEEELKKLDRAYIPEFIAQQGEALGINESDLTTALERFDELGFEDYPEPPEFDDDIFPAFGVEGFKERALQIIDMFISWLKRAVKWVFETLDTVSIAAKFKREQFRQLKYDVRRKSFHGSGTFKFSRNVSSICVFYKPLPDIGKVNGALTTYGHVIDNFYKHINTIVGSGRMSAILAEISAGDHLSEGLAKSVLSISPVTLESKLNMIDAADVSNGKMTRALLGNARLLLTKPTNLSTIRQVSQIEFQLARVTKVPQPIPETVVFPHFDKRQAESVINTAIGVLDVVVDAVDGKSRRSLSRMVNDIDTMTTRLRRDYNTFGGDSLQHRLNLTKKMMEWFNQPYRSLAISSTRTLGGIRHLCHRNFAR